MPNAAVTGLVEEADKSGRLPEAERQLRGLRPGYTRTSAYHSALGYLHNKLGRAEEALADYRRALAIDPRDQLAIEETVSFFCRLGREQEARVFFRQASGRAAGKVSDLNQLAVVALRQGWAAEAEPLLRRVLESDPGNPGVLANLAASLKQQGRSGDALAAMREAVSRDPGNARNQFNFGAMLADQGRFADALKAFETASANGLRSPQVHIAAAKMHFRLGDPGGSARELEKALALDPSNDEAREMLAALKAG